MNDAWRSAHGWFTASLQPVLPGQLIETRSGVPRHVARLPLKDFIMNDTFRHSADTLFHAKCAEAGSNAEKLIILRQRMQRRMRDLRQTERSAREAARLHAQSPSAAWRTAT